MHPAWVSVILLQERGVIVGFSSMSQKSFSWEGGNSGEFVSSTESYKISLFYMKKLIKNHEGLLIWS